MHLKKLLLLSLGLLIAVYFINIRTSSSKTSSNPILSAVGECGLVDKELRFSCYRSTLERFYPGNLDEYVNKITREYDIEKVTSNKNYAIHGTNCHTFYHALGDFIATKSSEDLSIISNYCPHSCTGGCIMGLYKRRALQRNFDSDLLRQYYDICKTNEKKQCSHEIGHLLSDKYTTSVLGILDALSLENYSLKYPEEYLYTTFEEPNLNAPFEDCKKLVPDDMVDFCYTGIGHNQFEYSQFSESGYKSEIEKCEKVDPKNKSTCHAFLIFRVGINSAAPRFLENDPDGGMEVCNNIIAVSKNIDLLWRCYAGVGGGIGLFIESNYPQYKFMSGSQATLAQQVSDYSLLCEKVPKAHVEDCYKGLLGTSFYSLYSLLQSQVENAKNPTIEKLLAANPPKVSDEAQAKEDNGFFFK